MQIKLWYACRSAVLAGGLALVALNVSAQTAGQSSICTASGYVLAFFNGVWNTPDAAMEGLENLSTLVGDEYKGEKISPELFYNTSGTLASRPDISALEDVAEVFAQRATELDGTFASRWEYFGELVAGGPTPLWDRLIRAVPAAAAVESSLVDAIRARAVAVLLNLRSHPPTVSDNVRHSTRLQAMVTEKKKVLMVAHSQGNLFANSAFTKVSQVVGATGAVKLVHIAPASTELHGDYTLADIDLVINVALRAVAPGSVPASNISMPVSSSDRSGHELVPTYLNETREARVNIKTKMTTALDALVVPATNGVTGFFTVTLTWDGSGDVDLHAFEPSGSHVFYGSTRGQVGFLDTDNTGANGPEHYFASCDPAVLQPGTYRFGINNFGAPSERTATMQVASIAGGELLTRSLNVGSAKGGSGNNGPIPVFTVTVVKSGTSTFSVTAAPQ